jgi:pimeloyl-ACP methyl ester carboxylesterase/DNA-binding winged helix-turn-helix (wHTH) protein
MYSFEGFVLDPDGYELRNQGDLVCLEPQVMDVLIYLVRHRDRVVPKDELFEQVSGTRFVSDAALTTRIREVRRALGDSGAGQRLIRTVRGRGYRFIGEVETPTGESPRSEVVPVAGGTLVRFCTTADGVSIAYASTGDGPPFVKAAHWLTHIDYDDQSPVWRHMFGDIAADFRLIRYDARGSGLSDRDVPEFSFDAWVRDLETVVDALELERFPLLGVSQGGAVAIRYAVDHPERVSHLILLGAYARGRNLRDEHSREAGQALMTLAAQGWGDEDSAFARLFSERMIPSGSPEQQAWLTRLQRLSASTENALRFRLASGDVNVESRLPEVRVPTLVLHARGDQTVPLEEGRLLASQIRGARLVVLDSDNHLLLEGEPTWSTAYQEIRSFVLGSQQAL